MTHILASIATLAIGWLCVRGLMRLYKRIDDHERYRADVIGMPLDEETMARLRREATNDA